MGVVVITPSALKGDTAVTGTAILAGSAAMPLTTGTDSFTIAATGTEILIVLNTTTGAITMTITGQPDPYGRTANFSMSVPGSPGPLPATGSFIVTPRLSASLWSAGSPAVITVPSSVPAGLAIAALTGT